MTGSFDAQNIDPAGAPTVSTWPVLARLPDVSTERGGEGKALRAEGEGREVGQSGRDSDPDRIAASPQTGYRFDPPESFGPHMATDPTAMAATSAGRSKTTIRASRQGEPWPPTRRARTVQPPRNILPDSSLFNMRGSSRASVLSAVVQFLLLFALFTVAGSFLLLIRAGGQWTIRESSPIAPTADQAAALPAANTEPEAAGPAAVQEHLDWDLLESPAASRPAPQSPPPGDSAGKPSTADGQPQAATGRPSASGGLCPTQRAADESTALPYPSTAFPPTVLSEGVEGSLPRIRTTDQPVARLPGYISEAPVHQAHDDRHEPSLH